MDICMDISVVYFVENKMCLKTSTTAVHLHNIYALTNSKGQVFCSRIYWSGRPILINGKRT